jgi:GNAT superfamily N-acetyltransferase
MQIVTDRFTIRPVTPGDHLAVLDVYRQCEDFLALGPDPHASPDMIARDLRLSQEQGGVFCGIYDPAGQMIGVVDVVPRLYQGDPALAFLELLMIAQPYRSVGLGAEIVRAVESVVRRDGAVRAILAGVQVNNPGAIRFWARMGYRITGGPTLQPDQTTCYDLRKDFVDQG